MIRITSFEKLIQFLRKIADAYCQADYAKLYQELQLRYEQQIFSAFLDGHPSWSIVQREAAYTLLLYHNWRFSRDRAENARQMTVIAQEIEQHYSDTEKMPISMEAAETVMRAVERVYLFSRHIWKEHHTLIFLLPATHKTEDSFCRCYQSTDGKIIAVPCDEVVEEIQLIERLLCTPPTIGATLREKRIVSVDDSISLKQVIRLIANTNYSNLPVYRGKRMVGIVNNRRIIKELGTVIERGGDIDAFASQTPVVQIVRESDLFTYYKYLSKNDTLQDILDAFEENKKLLAVLVSENGREGERVENIVTPADLVQVNKILEDYR